MIDLDKLKEKILEKVPKYEITELEVSGNYLVGVIEFNSKKRYFSQEHKDWDWSEETYDEVSKLIDIAAWSAFRDG